MKLKINAPVIDVMTGNQAELPPFGVCTLRTLVCFVGSAPAPGANGGVEPKEDAAMAFMLAARAAALPKDDPNAEFELDLKEASFLKTRAYAVLFPKFAGPLDMALEAAAGPPDGNIGAARV